MKKLLTVLVLLGMLLSLQASFIGAQGPDTTDTPQPTTAIAEQPAQSTETVTETPVVTPTTEVVVETPVVTPTETATEVPTAIPTTEVVTETPVVTPTETATEVPTAIPTEEITETPTVTPTVEPTVVITPTATATPAVSAAGDVGAQGSFNAGTGVSKIAVMNIDSSGSAAYSVSFYSLNVAGPDDTTTLAGASPLAYRAAAYYDLSTLGLIFGSGWAGSVVIASDKEVFAVVDDTYTGGTYTGGDGFNGEAYEAPEPSTDIFLPYATKFTDRFSRISVQGTKSSGSTAVTLSYRDQNGNVATCTNPTTLNLTDSRAISFEPVFNCVAGNTPNGSVHITSPDLVVATFDGSWKLGWKTGYTGIPASKASNTLYYPNIFRRINSAGVWGQWSNLFVQNTSGTQVRVRVSLYNTGAASPSMQFEVDIPAFSAKEFNTHYGGTGGNPSAAAFAAMGTNFAGTAIVDKLTGPDNALVGVAHNFWSGGFFGGSTYNAFAASQAGSTLYIPFSARKVAGSTWTQWDKLSIMNITGSAVQVQVKYYNGSGGVALDLTGGGGINIPNLSVDSINTRYGCDSGACSAASLTSLGNNFEGTVVVTGPPGSQLLGIMNVLYPNRLNTFNGKAK